MRYDGQCFKFLNGFINDRVMTLSLFSLKACATHGFQNSFLTKFNSFGNKQQNLHIKLPIDEV